MNASHKANRLKNRLRRLQRKSKTKEGLNPRQLERLNQLS